MNSTIYYLEANGPFHFGEAGVGVEASRLWPRADTLFAALCLELRSLYGEMTLTEFLNAFPTTANPEAAPPILLSSAFPYLSLGDQRLRLYPRPMLTLVPGKQDTDESDGQTGKTFRKVALVSEPLFAMWLRGEGARREQLPENVLQNSVVWVTTAERQPILTTLKEMRLDKEWREAFWHEEPVPRVTLDRATSSSQIYHSGRVQFVAGSGLWLAVRWLDENWRDKVETAFTSLGDAGIGGERSAGYGQFKLILAAGEALPVISGQSQITLSPYHPTEVEVQAGVLNKPASYQLILRRGWLGSPENGALRHQTVRMLAEGSHFLGNGRSHFGDLVNVTPAGFTKHPVYRYGLAFPIGVARDE
jgi:CRISPR-associated protein Csm4